MILAAGSILAAAIFASALLSRVQLSASLRRALIVLGTMGCAATVFTAEMLWRIPHGGLCVPLLGAALLVRRLPRPPPAVERERDGRWRNLFFAAAGLAAICIAEHFYRYPDGAVDAFTIWTLRARWLFRAKDHFATAFSPEILFWAHQDYPLLLPGMVAQGFSLAHSESALIPMAVAAAFAALSAWIAVAAIPGAGGFLLGIALVTTPNFVLSAAMQQADVPLSAFLVACVALLVARRAGDHASVAAAGAFAAMGAWTKNEGILLFAALLLAVLCAFRLRAALAFLLGALPILAVLISFKIAYAPANDLLQSTLAAALSRAAQPWRWWSAARLILRHLVLLQIWGVHLLALIAFALFRRRAPGASSMPAAVSWATVALFCAYLFLYAAQPHDPAYMVQVTFDRLLMQLWPSLLLLAFWSEFGAPGGRYSFSRSSFR